jgi:CHAT domain-containing protein
MKRRLNDDKLLKLADSYVRELFPNADRVGCPTDEDLQFLVEHPTGTTVATTDHISCCSPCYERYSELLQQQKQAMRAGEFAAPRWGWKRFVWAAVPAVIVLVVLAVLLSKSRSRPDTYATFAIDLANVTAARGANGESNRSLIEVPQERLDLEVRLPIGSEEGAYQVSLRSGPSVLWSDVEQASLIENVVRLKVRVDLRPFSAGGYDLTVESATGVRFVQPIQLANKHVSSRSTWRGRMAASAASRLMSIRLPKWSREDSGTARTTNQNAGQLVAEADRLAWLGNWPAAAPLYQRAELVASQAQDAKLTVHARIGRIRSLAETMPFAEVSEMLAKELDSPIVQADPKLRLFCLTAKGYTDLDVNVASCREDWEQALQTARELHDPLWESRASGELGIVTFLEGDWAHAQKLVGSALLSAMRNGDIAAQVRFLSMIGNGLTDLQRYDEASQFFSRALNLAANTKDIGFPFMAYEGQARCLAALDKPADARQLLETALGRARQDLKRGHQAQILILLGEVSLTDNNLREAENYLRAAGELSRASQFRRMETEAMYQLATIYRSENRTKELEESLQRGIEASRAVGDTYYLPRDLSQLAEVKRIRGDTRKADLLWEQATDVLEGMLMYAPSAYARSTMVAAGSDIYLRHFALAVANGDVSKAFRIVERARGRSVADLMWRRGSADKTARADTSADRRIASLQIELIRAESAKDREKLLTSLFEEEQKRALAVTARSHSYVVQRPALLNQVRASLRSDEALLEYVLSDPESYCIVLTRGGARLLPLGASRGRIDVLVHDYLTRLRRRDDAADAARELYGILLSGCSEVEMKPRIVIVPDGTLHLLPFDALRDSTGKYVLETSVVTYAPSATVLRHLREGNRDVAPLPFLGVGGVSYETAVASASTTGNSKGSAVRGVYDLAGAHFDPLPSSRDEVVRASEIFGTGSTVLLGREATETAFKREPLSKFRVLHLAVHGIASSQYPERAALVLGRDPESDDDGLLQAREIASLSLKADLVTLSACDTGVGRLQGEEGNASLQRAFLLAGARTTLSTLWTADDTFTAALIGDFYKNLATGIDKGAALRKAKLDLIKKYGDRAIAFYWAGFVLDGDSTSQLFPRQ